MIAIKSNLCMTMNIRHGKPIDMSDFKILGRPITLADVLRAWRKSEEPSTWWSDTCIVICKNWNLEKDLDGQSEETISFLSNLLNK